MAWEAQRTRVHAVWRADWERTHPPHLGVPVWNYLFEGGKEIRARLFCELWTYLAPDQPVIADLAFVVECLHSASLIIDDSPYMDNASIRRGQPTLHTQYPMPVVAHLCYDVIDMARRIWIAHRPAAMEMADWNEWMRGCIQRLIVGQWCDIERQGTALELASLKTGVLFEWVAGTVARCVGLDSVFWQRWGNQVGVLFQWTDDKDDREEDQAAGSRNAFLEAPDVTHAQYGAIWNAVQTGVGKEWWSRPFGAYLYAYFNWCSADPSPLSLIMLPALFSGIPEANGMYANDLITLMYHATAVIKEDDQVNLSWDQPWEEWVIEPYLQEAEQRLEWNIRPTVERLRQAYQKNASAETYQNIINRGKNEVLSQLYKRQNGV